MRTQKRRGPAAQRRLVSPGNAIMAIGCGHVLWALVAYRKPLGEIVGAGVVDTVGDGIFKHDHADDARAAGFWFLFVAPMIVMCGYLVEAAVRAGDRRALMVSGRIVLGLGLVGLVVMPRAGFVAVPPAGLWLMRRGAGRG